jgi:phenylalanyl-tRNA synthetase beta chain
MRSSLIGSLVEVLRVNVARKATRLRVFELGKVYLRDPGAAKGELSVDGIGQPLRLGGLAFGPAEPAQWGVPERAVDFFDVKGDLESLLLPAVARFVPAAHPALHPGRSASIELDGVLVGHLGELHPRWRQAYDLSSSPIVFELDAAALMRRSLPVFAPLPKQQPAWRDIAVVAGRDVSHAALMEAIESGGGAAVRSATLFDIYEPKAAGAGIGEGERSLAVRLEVRDDAQTLTDERIDAVVAGVLTALEQRLGVRLRK